MKPNKINMFEQLSAEFVAYGSVFLVFWILNIFFSKFKNRDKKNKTKKKSKIKNSIRSIEIKSDSKKEVQKENNRKSDKKENLFFIFKIFPKVNHFIWWHRLVTGIGVFLIILWGIMLILSEIYDTAAGWNTSRDTTFADLALVIFWITLLYFILGQRIIYFIAYGNDQGQWRITKENNEVATSGDDSRERFPL